MAAYREVGAEHYADLVVGVVLLSVWLVMTARSVTRWVFRRRRSAELSASAIRAGNRPAWESDIPSEPCVGLMAEARIVRDRVSGQIDAATYQKRMKDLVSKGRS
jgi:hypothetical protein